MKVVIAAWHVKNPHVGLGRYVKGLINALAAAETPHQYVVLLPEPPRDLPRSPWISYRTYRVPFFKRRVWEQLTPAVAGTYDVLHLPYDSAVAWRKGKQIVTIHDVKPLIFGDASSRPPRRRWLERALIPDPWKTIDFVVTDSVSSRRDILARLPIGPEQVSVVYPGIDLDRFRPADQRLTGRGRPYVLSLAGADPTKNVTMLVQAFAALPAALRTTYDLVLVGDFRRRPEIAREVADLGLEKQTRFTGTVDDSTLIELYQHATVMVFPSLYEGFGYPVVEAMACGCPVITSNVSSLPEVAGDAAILVEPRDVIRLTAEIEGVLEDAALRHAMRARGLQQAARFSWSRAARELINVYEKVAGQQEASCVS